MKSQMTSDLAIDALLMAIWRLKPKQEVMVHPDKDHNMAVANFANDYGATACARA